MVQVEGTTMLPNVWHHSPTDTPSHHKRKEQFCENFLSPQF